MFEVRNLTQVTGDPQVGANRSEWAMHVWLPAAAALLSIVVGTGTISGVLLLAGATVTGFELPISLGVTGLWTLIWCRRSFHHRWVIAWTTLLFGCLCIIGGSLFFSGRVLDDSWDGQWFHQEAVIQLADGWNPVFEPLNVERVPEIGAHTRIDGYPKGQWLWGASLYRLTNRIERAKAFAVPLIVAAFAATLAALLLVTRLHGMTAFACAVLFAASPVTTLQFLNLLQDGPLGSALLIVVAGSVIWLSTESRLALFLVGTGAAAACALKLTGPVYVSILAAALAVAAWRTGALGRRFRDLLIAALASATVALALSGMSYAVNWARHGHVMYPVMGDKPVKIRSRSSQNRIEGLVASLVFPATSQFEHRSTILDLGNLERYRWPFTVTREELDLYIDPHLRIGGWGPLCSGLLLLTVALIATACVVDRTRLGRLLIALSPVALTVLINPMCWKARYIPQAWIIPMSLMVYALDSSRSRMIRTLGWLLLATATVNLLLVGSTHISGNLRHSERLKQRILELKMRREPLVVSFGTFRSNRIRLAELGVPFEETDDPRYHLPTYLGKSLTEVIQFTLLRAPGGGTQAELAWTPVEHALSYLVEVIVPPPLGPNGGALTVVQRRFNTSYGIVPLPAGPCNLMISSCNRILSLIHI